VDDIIIRRATPSGASLLADLGTRIFRATFAADNRPEDLESYLAEAYGPAQQTAELNDSTIVTLLAGPDGAPAGFAQLRLGKTHPCVIGADQVELWRFYVDQAWHGRGVAQRLMAEVLREAVASGGKTLWLAVWERNERAKAFYRKFGFADVGSQPFMMGSDAQTDRVMMLDINCG
jgi:ribosomal protein S18 acetylase RimI-like enzyme